MRMPGTLVAIGLELAAELGRGVGLEVVHVEVAGPAAEPEEDDRGVACVGLPASPRPRLEAQVVGQRQAGQAEEADLQEARAG